MDIKGNFISYFFLFPPFILLRDLFLDTKSERWFLKRILRNRIYTINTIYARRNRSNFDKLLFYPSPEDEKTDRIDARIFPFL